MRFGLLGTGYWAQYTQGAALIRHPDVELVGVWGRNPAKAEALAAALDANVAGYSEVDELLAAVDAVAVALPPDIQADLAERAARAGKHLLLDKPLALSVDAADRVVTAVEAAGVSAVIFFTRRFDPTIASFIIDAAARDWDGAQA